MYLYDSGLANILGNTSFGNIFENAIFHELRSLGEVKYYQRKNGTEIDFILDGKIAYEAKTKANQQDILRLNRLIKDLYLKEGKIVSFEYVNIPAFYGFQF